VQFALTVPTIYDRVCQQALLNRLEPIFEPVFDDASFGYRRGRSTKDALRKIWKEIQGGSEWIVDGDLRDFFGSVDHEKLLTLVAQRVADGRKHWRNAGWKRLPPRMLYREHGLVNLVRLIPSLASRFESS
jgi:retron-type reverse transcriptase